VLRKLLILIGALCLALAWQPLAAAQSSSLPQVVAGLEWDEIDSGYLPDGIQVQGFPASGRDSEGDWKSFRMSVVFPNGVSIDTSLDDLAGSAAAVGGCTHSDDARDLLIFSSMCPGWPEFRQTVILLIVLGHHDIVYVGEFRNYPVDLDDLNITRADISAFALAAAALNPSNEE
jgi:hypothetical protein